MQKKGQVTIFIILAILIIVGVAGYFIFKEKASNKTFSVDISSVETFVSSCILNSLDYVSYELALGGGYFLPPLASTSSGIPYYNLNGIPISPQISLLEKEFSDYLDFSIIACVTDFEDFEDLNISYGEINSVVNFLEEEILLDVYFPIELGKGNDQFLLEDFKGFKIYSNFKKLYLVSFEIAKDYNDRKAVCLSCLSNLALRENVEINVETPDDETILFKIKDKEGLQFNFAIKDEF